MYQVVSKLKLLKKEFKKMDGANINCIEKRADLMLLALKNCQEELWNDPSNLNLIEVERNYNKEYLKTPRKISYTKKANVTGLTRGMTTRLSFMPPSEKWLHTTESSPLMICTARSVTPLKQFKLPL